MIDMDRFQTLNCYFYLRWLNTGMGRECSFSRKLNRLPQERPVLPRYLPFADAGALVCCWAGKAYNRPESDIHGVLGYVSDAAWSGHS